MIGDGKKYHYLAVTNLSGLLKGVSSNHKEDFYCLNCFNSYTTKNKLKEHEEICNKHDSCRMEMPEQVILKHNPGEKSLKAPFTIYLDLECILKKYNLVKTTLKNLIQKKQLDMSPLAGQCLKNVPLMKKKINLITTEEKIVLKYYVKN